MTSVSAAGTLQFRPKFGMLCMATAIFVFGSTDAIVKLASANLHPTQIGFCRFLISLEREAAAGKGEPLMVLVRAEKLPAMARHLNTDLPTYFSASLSETTEPDDVIIERRIARLGKLLREDPDLRALRLLESSCEAAELDLDTCFQNVGLSRAEEFIDFDSVLRKAEGRGVCEAERTAPVDSLRYEEVDLGL